jgi:hypothetical protein
MMQNKIKFSLPVLIKQHAMNMYGRVETTDF